MTALISNQPAEPRTLRLLPRPQSEPPYDDELPAMRRDGGPSTVQGTLALTFTVGNDVPAVPEPPAQLRLLAPDEPTAEDEAREIEVFCARRATSRVELPDPRRWSARLAQGLVEVLAGVRPLPQLAPWVSEEVFAELQPRVRARERSDVRHPNQPTARMRTQLRTLRLCEPADGVAEVSAVVQHGNRCRALALRLEGLDGRWRCTALEFV